MNKNIKCLAIDDEPPALEIIEKFCQRIGNVEFRKFSDPVSGLETIREWSPDIVFLDIEMDGLNGLEIASRLPEEICFVFTTAYLRYALEGYDLDAVDYLHKPFSFSRFQIAFSKALRRIGRKQLKTASQCLIVKQDYNSVSIPVDDIVYIEALEGYSRIFRTSGNCIMSRILLKNIFSLLPQDSFLRIHRSFIISKSKIRSFNRQEVFLVNDVRLPVGRQYSSGLSELMSGAESHIK